MNSTAVRLLIDAGVLSESDARAIKDAHGEHLLSLLIKQHTILPEESQQAREALRDIDGLHQAKKMAAQVTLVRMLTRGVNRRVHCASERLIEQRDRITSDDHVAIPARAAAEKG